MKVNLGVVEFEDGDLFKTETEVLEEQERLKKELDAQQKDMEDVKDEGLEADLTEKEERAATALDILQREKKLQLEREEVWNKERKHNKMVRTVKAVVLLAIIAILVIAYVSGYRIPIPESWMVHIQGIYNTAFDAVIKFFTNH